MATAATSKVGAILGLDNSGMTQLISALGVDLTNLGAGSVFNLTLTDEEWNSVPTIREAVAYQGFDPLRIIKEFMKKALNNPAVVGEKPISVTVGDSSFKIFEKAEPKTDLLFLITLFLTRGNNVAKILLKCDSAVTDTITRKCNQYGISTSARTGTGPLGPSVITLARLAQSFLPATLTAIIGHNLVGNLKSKLFPGVTLPLVMTHTIFPGLLRESDTELIEVAKYLNVEMSLMLSTPTRRNNMLLGTNKTTFDGIL